MIFGFSLLIFLLALVTGIPAARGLLRMREINQHRAETGGTVTSSKSATGWLWTASYGNQDRPLVMYQTPKGEEMVLQIVTSSILPQRRYEPGQAVTVVYDTSMPGSAYVKDEWQVAVRDAWLAAGALFVAVVLLVAGILLTKAALAAV
jgi:hypothetical protein